MMDRRIILKTSCSGLVRAGFRMFGTERNDRFMRGLVSACLGHNTVTGLREGWFQHVWDIIQ
jgi:hypothetical protein